MIIADTNVASALMRLAGEPEVEAWLDQQRAADLFISAPTLFEVRLGIERVPAGRRRRALEASFESVLSTVFAGRIADLDATAADLAGRLGAARLRSGAPAGDLDTLIAGICVARKAALATRNTRHFEGLGIVLIDPWRPAGPSP